MATRVPRLGSKKAPKVAPAERPTDPVPEPMRPRKGRIDQIENLRTLDLLAFNASVNPWNNQYITGGFKPGAEYFRSMVEKWGFTGLDTVVDVGSGYGRWAVFLAEANERVFGYERNEAAVVLSRNLAEYFGLTNLTFEAGVASALPAPDNIADGVWCFNGLHLFPRGTTLAEARRITKPGGLLFLGAYNGLGTLLQKFVEGYLRGGLNDNATRFALQAMKESACPEAAGWSYADINGIAGILEHYSFELAGDPPPELQYNPRRSTSPLYARELADVPAFAERLETDEGFRAEFLRHPQITYDYPINVNILARRR